MAVWESCTKLSAVKCNSFSLNFSLTCLHVWSHPRQCRQCWRLSGETVEDDNAGNDTLHQCQVCRLDFKPTWGPTWSQLGAKLEPSWDQKSNKIGPKSDPKCDHSSKMLQKSTQIGPKAFLERSGGFLVGFWSQVGAKLALKSGQEGPSWGQDGAKFGQVGAKFGQVEFWSQLGPTWSQLGGKMEPSWNQKSTKIGPKSDPRCNHFLIGCWKRFEIYFG